MGAEAGDQTQVSFIRSYIPYFLRKGLSLGSGTWDLVSRASLLDSDSTFPGTGFINALYMGGGAGD